MEKLMNNDHNIGSPAANGNMINSAAVRDSGAKKLSYKRIK